VEAILRRRHKFGIAGEGPIFIVCFTNHALDQFLEGMLTFTENMVRIGGRCQNENLKKFTAIEVQRRIGRGLRVDVNTYQQERDIRNRLSVLQEQAVLQQFRSSVVASGDGILSTEFVRNSIDPTVQFPIDYSMVKWLGLDGNALASIDPFIASVIEEEKTGVTVAQINNRRMYEVEDEEFVDAVEDADDGDDDGIEDEVDFEARKREVDNLYVDELDDAQIPKDISVGVKNNEIDQMFEIYEAKLATRYQLITEELTLMEAEWRQNAEDVKARKLSVDKFNDWLAENQQQAVRYQTELRRVDILRNQLKTALRLLCVPKGFDLPEPNHNRYQLVNLPIKERWLLYRHWANKYVRQIGTAMLNSAEEYKQVGQQLDEVRAIRTLTMVREMDIVGMTTTGAAKNISIVQNMGSKVVVVEEAAEVLESHIVCCLSKSCQHLILIGDHQQLKPSPTVYKLAKDYHLDVSLFERMINNEVPYERLRIQHRMRPEIAALLKPHIYEDLENSDSVYDYPDVKGTIIRVKMCSLNKLVLI
jgi:hypothetical protein